MCGRFLSTSEELVVWPSVLKCGALCLSTDSPLHIRRHFGHRPATARLEVATAVGDVLEPHVDCLRTAPGELRYHSLEGGPRRSPRVTRKRSQSGKAAWPPICARRSLQCRVFSL
jgi:hypothetical protein